MKKALYFHGFLGCPNDMKPLFISGYECISVDIKSFFNDIESFFKTYDETYAFSVGYSFGGRFLAKLLTINPEFVEKTVFCSSRLTGYSSEELVNRKKFKNILQTKNNASEEEFYSYWNSLELFSDHDMTEYRKKEGLYFKRWSKESIDSYLKDHFTYEAPSLDLFNDKSWFFYGEKDEKYKSEAHKIGMKTHEFKDLGHRFIFEDPVGFKNFLKKEVL